MKRLRIGTRGSKLALAQTKLVQEAISSIIPDIDMEICVIKTRGDIILDKPLNELGDKGLFAKEFEQAILSNEIDLAVHSAKDLPVKLAEGLDILFVLPRADERDVLIQKKTNFGGGFDTLPSNPVIGTCSARRELYIKRFRLDTKFKLIRGNIDTRLSKLNSGFYDAIVLAKAGLDRINIIENYSDRFDFTILDTKEFLPSACQGIIAVEGMNNFKLRQILEKLNDTDTYIQYKVERKVLELLQTDCSQPVAAFCKLINNDTIKLHIMYGGREVCGYSAKEEYLQLIQNLLNQLKENI